jgi:spermidine synthase
VSRPLRIGFALKAALFATGCAGIIAEFVLSTLATYLAGNAVFQWTIVMSLMLFAMGVGSRLSRRFRKRLLDTFILTEFSLSVLCAASAVFAYGVAAYSDFTDLIIYLEAFVIGTLIGFEIPLVTRINDAYEELRVNISGVMEKDYYGALAGGVLFAFVALPYLGMTYTPILLGGINFLVASLILWRFFALVENQRTLAACFALVLVFLTALGVLARPIVLFGEQRKYRDKVVYARQTPYQKIVMTRWKTHYWLYINGQEQFSTFDEERYHEPLVHPAMKLSADRADVLIIGGGDGLAAREVLKHPGVASVTLVDMDPAMTTLARTHPVLAGINQGALNDPRVGIVNDDAAAYLDRDARLYGVIIVDLPDPDSVDLMHVYSKTFYGRLRRHLVEGGVMVTQAASPYFAPKAFRCLVKTIRAAGFPVLPYHNQIPTMGEWGWVMGMKSRRIDAAGMKSAMIACTFEDIGTRYINRDAMISMLHFGKGVLEPEHMAAVEVNTELNPVLYRYYLAGVWGVY